MICGVLVMWSTTVVVGGSSGDHLLRALFVPGALGPSCEEQSWRCYRTVFLIVYDGLCNGCPLYPCRLPSALLLKYQI